MIGEIIEEFGLNENDIPNLEKAKERALNDFDKIPKKLSGCSLEEYTKKMMINEAKRIKRTNSETIFGVIISFSPPKSSTNRKIKEAVIAYKQNSEKAITDGYVAEYKKINRTQFQVRKLVKGQNVVGTKIESKIPEGAINIGDGSDISIVPLDNQKTFRNGKPSFKYLIPLPTEAYFCNISGIILNTDGTTDKFKMSINTNNSSFVVPMNKTIQFRAEIGERDKKDGFIQLKYKKDDTKFELMEGDIKDLLTVISEIRPITNIVDIPAIQDKVQKGSYGEPIAIAGTVVELWVNEPTDDKPNAMSTLYVEDTSTDIPIKVLCHKVIPMNFGINSFVLVFGSTSKGKKWDKEKKESGTDDEYSVWADGLVVIVNSSPEEPPQPIGPENLKTESGESWD